MITTAQIPAVITASKAQVTREVQTTVTCVAAKALAAQAQAAEARAAEAPAAGVAATVAQGVAATAKAAAAAPLSLLKQGPIPCSSMEQNHQGVFAQKLHVK